MTTDGEIMKAFKSSVFKIENGNILAKGRDIKTYE